MQFQFPTSPSSGQTQSQFPQTDSNRFQIQSEIPQFHDYSQLMKELRRGRSGIYNPRNGHHPILYRDPFGTSPVFVSLEPDQDGSLIYHIREKFFWSNSPKINRDFFLNLMVENFQNRRETPDQRTLRLEPGFQLELNPSGSTQTQRWYHSHNSPAAQVKGLREAAEALETQIFPQVFKTQPGHKNALFFSGGLDSSLLANEILKSEPLACFNFEGLDKLAQPPQERLSWLKSHSESSLVVINEAEAQPELWLNSGFETNMFYTPNLALYTPLLKKAKELGFTQALTGLGGDDLFTLEPSNFLKKVMPKSLKTSIRRMRARIEDQKLNGEALEHLNSHFEALNQAECLRGNSFKGQLVHRLERRGAYTFAFEQEQALAKKFGMQMSYPFFHADIYEFLISLPASVWKESNLRKPLLRTIASGKVPFAGTDFPQSLEGVCRRTLKASQHQWLPLINGEYLWDLIDPEDFGLNPSDQNYWRAFFDTDLFYKIIYCERILRSIASRDEKEN